MEQAAYVVPFLQLQSIEAGAAIAFVNKIKEHRTFSRRIQKMPAMEPF